MPTKAAIVTRGQSSSTISTENLNKNEPLTFEDIDSTLINLRDSTHAIAGDSGSKDVTQGDTVTIAGGTGAGGITIGTSNGTLTVDASTINNAINIDGGSSTTTYGGTTTINGGTSA